MAGRWSEKKGTKKYEKHGRGKKKNESTEDKNTEQMVWEQYSGQISVAPLSLTLAFCSEQMMPRDAHH